MRRLIPVLALLAWLAAPAAPALAQVAAPSILPASPGTADPTTLRRPTLVPTNPAALSWASPSKVAVGTFRSTRDVSASVVSGVTVPKASYDYTGSYGGFQAVGERLALAVDALQAQDTSPGTQLNANDSAAALSFQLGNAFALGAGYTGVHEENGVENSDSHATLGGVSLRLGEVFYLGAASGREKILRTATAAGGVPLHAERSETAYGAGIRKGGALRLHLEYYVLQADSFQYQGLKTLGGSLKAGVVEAGFWHILIGYTAVTVDLPDDRITFSGSEATLGFAGDHGLAVLFHYSRGATRASAFDLDVNAVSQAVSVAWQF